MPCLIGDCKRSISMLLFTRNPFPEVSCVILLLQLESRKYTGKFKENAYETDLRALSSDERFIWRHFNERFGMAEGELRQSILPAGVRRSVTQTLPLRFFDCQRVTDAVQLFKCIGGDAWKNCLFAGDVIHPVVKANS